MFEAEIGLADLLMAVERLGIRDVALVRHVASLLDVAAAPPRRSAEARPPDPLPPPVEQPKTPQSETAPSAAESVRSTLTQTTSEAPAFASPVPALPQAIDEEREVPPKLDPLFEPLWTRAILGLSLATPGDHGPVDVRRVVERLSRGAAVERLPRRVVPTMRKGVQVLVDRSAAMIPFARDAEWLVREIAAVAGKETPILRFRGLPSRGVSDPARKKRAAYAPPPPGVPVAIVTDFGLGVDDLANDRATTREWTEFLRAVRRTDSPIVAFVPYPRQRCPQSIAALVTYVEWDRLTSLTRIRTAVRAGWRRR